MNYYLLSRRNSDAISKAMSLFDAKRSISSILALWSVFLRAAPKLKNSLKQRKRTERQKTKRTFVRQFGNELHE